MADFKARIRSLKPGSIDQHGNVIDYQGGVAAFGPCFIPSDISAARKGELGARGWCKTPAAHWPGIPPIPGLSCIHRGELP